MQVLNLGILLVLATFGTFFVSNVFAESEILVEFNQDGYQTGDSLTISGHIPEVTMPVIAMSVFDPDGTILSANNIEIDSENTFSKTIMLEAPFYEKPGEYRIQLDYLQIRQNEYFVISGESLPELIFDEEISPEIILLLTDKPVYADNDTIVVTGMVSSMDSPTALVGVYDPFGTPAGFYFGKIDSNLEFTVSFLAKAGINFKTDGTYSIKAHYAESEQTTQFDFYEKLSIPDEIFEQPNNETTQTEESYNDSSNETIDDTIEETSVNETPETKPVPETIEEKTITPETSPTEPIDDSPIINDKPKSDDDTIINTKQSSNKI